MEVLQDRAAHQHFGVCLQDVDQDLSAEVVEVVKSHDYLGIAKQETVELDLYVRKS